MLSSLSSSRYHNYFGNCDDDDLGDVDDNGDDDGGDDDGGGDGSGGDDGDGVWSPSLS